MNLFWLEYLHFIVAIFAILVCVSSATLFYLTYRSESQLTTVWRAIGFGALAVAFFLFILERKFPGISTFALVVQLFGFYGIFRGMSADLSLEKLRKVAAVGRQKQKKGAKATKKSNVWTIITLIVFLIIFVLGYIFFRDFLNSVLVVGAIVFIVGSIRLQIQRLRAEVKDKKARRQNLWPLLAYIFFLYGEIAMTMYRLPDLDFVLLRELKLDFSLAWQLGLWFIIIGFVFLSLWAWTYIKVRAFLRTYVVFMTIGVFVSSLGALVFTQLIFTIVEDNNLELMEHGAQSEQVIAYDRLDTSLFIARLLAKDPEIISLTESGDATGLQEASEDQLLEAGLDVLRVYNEFGEVIASPGDERDSGELYNDDSYVAYVVAERAQVKTFDVQPGVLSPLVVARGLYPILNDNEEVVGVMEAGYKFDDAFVDFTKEETGLDATVYTDDERSATTITTLDGVSRWVGTKESDPVVLETVLENGGMYSTAVERLGTPYYSAYVPVRDINSEVIGMFSVGTPTVLLFEDTRQQLVSTFLIVTLISLVAAGLGYAAVRSFRKVKT